MKTAEEYIKDVESKTGEPFDKKYLEDVLLKDRNDYKQSIIGLIDKRLAEVANWAKLDSDSVALYDRAYKKALTELKNKVIAL